MYYDRLEAIDLAKLTRNEGTNLLQATQDRRVSVLPPGAILASQGRYSFVGAQPSMEVVAKGRSVEVLDHRAQRGGQNGAASCQELDDPMQASSGPQMGAARPRVPCMLRLRSYAVLNTRAHAPPSPGSLAMPSRRSHACQARSLALAHADKH